MAGGCLLGGEVENSVRIAADNESHPAVAQIADPVEKDKRRSHPITIWFAGLPQKEHISCHARLPDARQRKNIWRTTAQRRKRYWLMMAKCPPQKWAPGRP
jgi:hypothetical protein